MDGKETKPKKSTKERFISFFGSYIGMYIENIPKTKQELLEGLPKALLYLVKCAICTLVGYWFGSKTLFYSALPLGTSLLCSARKNVPFIYLGLIISAATERTGLALPLFLIYTALIIARILVYRTYGKNTDKPFSLFCEEKTYQMVEGIGASIFISFYRAAYFGFLYYDIMGGLLEIALVPVLIYLYDLLFDEKYKYSFKKEIGFASLLISIVASLGGRLLFGFSMPIMAVCLIGLYMSKTAGAVRGASYGLVCGFAANSVLSPVFAFASMAAGILWKIGKAYAITIYCITGILCGIYVEGWQSLTDFAPEFLLCGVLFMGLTQFKLLPTLELYNEGITPTDEADTSRILSERKQKDTEKRIEALSSAFTELSEVFYTLSDRTRRPGLIDTQAMCDKVRENYCPKCLFKRTCWEKEYSSSKNVFSKIAKELCEKGYVEQDCVEPYFYERCMHMDRIIERINDSHGFLLESMIKENKTEVFAMDYEAMGHLLEYAVKHNCEEYSPDEEMRIKLAEAGRKLKLYARNVCVYGKRKKTIIASGVDINRMKLSAKEIKESYENLLETRLNEPRYNIEGDYITMVLTSARRFRAEFAASTSTKLNENYCGDLICMFENGNDYFYSLISDGMGSGREAALTSRLCGVFLKKMLMAGNSKPVALEMLNNFIRSKNTECFSTVDLLEIDLLNGKAGFIKSGAMASYILRGDRIFRIASNTMPIGITQRISAEEVKFELKNNDLIVMVSDGVGQSPEDLVRVGNILTFDCEDNLQALADKILSDAVKKGGRSDDISIGVIRIKEE